MSESCNEDLCWNANNFHLHGLWGHAAYIIYPMSVFDDLKASKTAFKLSKYSSMLNITKKAMVFLPQCLRYIYLSSPPSPWIRYSYKRYFPRIMLDRPSEITMLQFLRWAKNYKHQQLHRKVLWRHVAYKTGLMVSFADLKNNVLVHWTASVASQKPSFNPSWTSCIWGIT